MTESTKESLCLSEYEELLPPDGELFQRRKVWSTLMEKYNEDTADGCAIGDISRSTTSSEMENENNTDDNESIPVDDYEDKNFESDNDKFNVQNVLNNTLKVVEKRKNNWHQTGVDKWLDKFCTNSHLDKVDDWLRKNEKYFIKGMYKHKYYTKSLDEIRITNRHFVMEKPFDSTSLDSVDTAKYILSNQRKTQKTRMRTMTIKSYRFLKEQRSKIIECGSQEHPDHHMSSVCKLQNRNYNIHNGCKLNNNNNNEKKKFRKRSHQYLKSPSLRSSSSSSSSSLSSSSINLLNDRKKYEKAIVKCAQYKNRMKKKKSSMSPVLECLEAKMRKNSYENMNKSNFRNKNEAKRSRRLHLLDSPKSVDYNKSFDNREISNEDNMKRSIRKSSEISREILNEKNSTKIDISNKIIDENNLSSDLISSQFCPENVINSTTLSGKNKKIERNKRLLSSSESCVSAGFPEKDKNIKRNKRLPSSESSNSTAIPEKEKIVERNKRSHSRESSSGNINSATSIIDLTSDKSNERSSGGSSPIIIYTPKIADSIQKNNIVNGKFLLTSKILEETVGSELAKTFLERNKNFSHSFNSQSEILFFPPDMSAETLESSDSEVDILETMSSRKYGQIIEVVKR